MKVKLGNVPLVYPVPIVLAGSLVDGTPNFATLGDCGIMGINPPLVYVSLHRDHHTTGGILEHQTFSVNLPNTKMLAVTDYCGIASGKEVDKAALFTCFFGETQTAPMIEECPVNLECRVVHQFAVQHRQVFVGEAVQTHVNAEYAVERNGRKTIANLQKLDPITYGLDNHYYSIGEIIGVGYQEGRNYRPGPAPAATESADDQVRQTLQQFFQRFEAFDGPGLLELCRPEGQMTTCGNDNNFLTRSFQEFAAHLDQVRQMVDIQKELTIERIGRPSIQDDLTAAVELEWRMKMPDSEGAHKSFVQLAKIDDRWLVSSLLDRGLELSENQ